jgi:hypothetical protein
MEVEEATLGNEIRNYRQRMRLAPNPVAQALGLTIDELLKLETDNQPLSPEQAQRWNIFRSVTRKSRGHVRRAAPMKDLPWSGPRPKCQECGLELVQRKCFYSRRAEQDVCQLACRTDGCSRYDEPISFTLDGHPISLPARLKLPFERPLCAECRRPLLKHGAPQNRQELGMLQRMYCNNSNCGEHFGPHWFDSAGKEVSLPHTRKTRPPFAYPSCAWCGGATVSLSSRESRGRGVYWVFRCKVCSKCSWTTDGTDVKKSSRSDKGPRAAQVRSRRPGAPHAGGRPPQKTQLFESARKLREQGLRWTQIAQQLDPKGFADDSRAAAERMRLGVKYLGLPRRHATGASA